MDSRELIGLAPALVIAGSNWAYRMLIVERYRGWNRLTRIQIFALGTFLCGGFGRWIGEICIRRHLTALQFVSALYASSCNWIGFLCIVNDRVTVSRQQVISYMFLIFITALWEIQHRIVLY